MTSDSDNAEDLREVAEKWDLTLGASDWESTRLLLAQKIEEMLRFRRSQLLNVLYRLDVSEKNSAQALQLGSLSEQATALAELILRREVEKAKTRRLYQGTKKIPG